MSPTAIVLILIAAVAHASWNLFSKQASAAGAVFFIWLMATGAAVCYLPVALIDAAVTRPHLGLANWVFLVGTGLLQAGYFLFLQLGYTAGDLSVVYPIGRGAGAMLAAVAGITLLGERPGALSVAGIVAIIAGVVAIGLPSGQEKREHPAEALAAAVPATEPAAGAAARLTDHGFRSREPGELPRDHDRNPSHVTSGADAPASPGKARAVGFALVTGAFIASYTIWDKYAVSNLHTPPILQGYASLLPMVIIFLPFVLRDRPAMTDFWHRYRRQALGASVLSPLAYMLVLVALSFTAVSAVAPAREVSVLFGVLLGRRLLGEGNLARRLAAAAAIVAGIIAIAVG